MTIIVDSRERAPVLKEHLDGVRLLTYGDKNESYDILIQRQHPPHLLRGERKRWSDLTSSMFPDDLTRQLVPCDFLLVELPTPDDKDKWKQRDFDLAERAWKRLTRMSLSGFPIIYTTGQHDTVKRLRYIEQRKDLGFQPRETGGIRADLLSAVISWMGINPERDAGGQTMRDAVAEMADLDGLADMLADKLKVEQWGEIYGVGPKMVERALARLHV